MLSSGLHAAINGSDDFDDNSKSSSRWGTDRLSSGAVLTETSKRLQFTTTSTATQIGYRPWVLNQATYDTNWEVVMDVNNSSPLTATGSYASVGFELFTTSGYTRSLYFGLYASTDDGVPAQRGFESGLLDAGDQYGYKSDTRGTTVGAIKLSFDATTKILTCYVDPDGATGGYVWEKHATYGLKGSGGETGNFDWGMADAGAFQLSIYGSSQNLPIAAGSLYADNFSASSSLTALTKAATSLTETTATLNASVYNNSVSSTLTFEYSTQPDFSSSITTAAQTVASSSSPTLASKTIAGLTLGTTYYVRAKATTAGGSVTGNTVTFATPPYHLAVSAESGSVGVSPNQATYPSGTLVTLTATPASGRTFLGWTGDLTGTTTPTTLTMNGNKSVVANFTLDLAPVLDSPALVFTTGGTAGWYGQKISAHDATGAAHSGKISNSQQSWMETTVTGPGKLEFWWKVSSEENDYLEFYVDGLRQSGRISGVQDWQKQSYELAAGTHTLRWNYVKDFIFSENEDAGWVDSISWVPGKTGFALWTSQKFSETELMDDTISGGQADPDHDGISNLLEYAFGGEPKVAAKVQIPVGQVEQIDADNYLTLTITKPAYANDVTYTPQVSSDLNQWFSGAIHTTVITNDGTTLKVRDNLPVEPGRKRFMRVEVNIP